MMRFYFSGFAKVIIDIITLVLLNDFVQYHVLIEASNGQNIIKTNM